VSGRTANEDPDCVINDLMTARVKKQQASCGHKPGGNLNIIDKQSALRLELILPRHQTNKKKKTKEKSPEDLQLRLVP
jgi:hypothetical protein